MSRKYTIGVDYGTNSVRAVLVDVDSGTEIADSIREYEHGQRGVETDPLNPLLARHHPADYLTGLQEVVPNVLQDAREKSDTEPRDVIGIGIDTTGSTPIPIDEQGRPLAFMPAFAVNLDAYAWLWKDHTAVEEAEEITYHARRLRPEYLEKVGGTYSSEWLWSKVLRCLRSDRNVFDTAHSWVEMSDWIPASLCGMNQNYLIRRGICAAGHKALYSPDWGGWPDVDFIGSLDAALRRTLQTFPQQVYSIHDRAGQLSDEWAQKLGLKAGTAVAVGAFDAHLGAVGCGVQPGVLIKNIGTSTCDMMIAPLSEKEPAIPGLAGIVRDSIVPGYYGVEAGQSAVGDIFNWFVTLVAPQGRDAHAELESRAMLIHPGESGLLALDWHNGNRTVLGDQRLSGILMGLTLQSNAPEVYRCLIEATAFGARIIRERFEECGLPVKRIITCGGIPTKSPLLMQIYADVLRMPIEMSRSAQTGALGSAIAASVVAGAAAGGHESFMSAIRSMTGTRKEMYTPIPENVRAYEKLYGLYRRMHDSYGVANCRDDQRDIMKELITFRDKTRQSKKAT